MLPPTTSNLIPTHWGTFQARTESGRIVAVAPADGTRSEFWRDLPGILNSHTRIRKPAIRKSFLDGAEKSDCTGRGTEAFVEVEWDEAFDIAAHHLRRIAAAFGNEAIYGGSYGWASAGRFHHAQSQIHRFLNAIGGYTRSVNSYRAPRFLTACAVLWPVRRLEEHMTCLGRVWRVGFAGFTGGGQRRLSALGG